MRNITGHWPFPAQSRDRAFSLLLLVLSVLSWPATLWLGQGTARFDHVPGRVVIVWDGVIPVLLAGLCLLLLLHGVHFTRRGKTPDASRMALRSAGIPLLMLSWIALQPALPAVGTNLVCTGLPLVLAWMLLPLLEKDAVRAGMFPRWRDWAILVGLFTLLYACMGVYFTESVGEHSGDEGHYLAQSNSLYHDGDLDLKNYFNDPGADKKALHISPRSLYDRWYSWHTPGLSFLLAPTVGGGIVPRHIVLGLIAGLGIAGTYLLSLCWGAQRKQAWLVSLLLGLGPFWGIYSCRALPEVLGGTLTVYGMLACFAQRSRPWSSLVLSVACVGFLPWAHTRFLPVGLTVFGCYGLYGLLGPEPWKRKIGRLALYSVLALAALGLYQYVQHLMFKDGLAYPVPKLLFSRPAGIWHTLASRRGILFMFPVFACALSAVVIMAAGRRHRLAGSFSLLVVLSVLLTACATRWWTAGACLPGRFLVVVAPVVCACLAVGLAGRVRGFLLLTLYLGLLPIALFAAQLFVLESFSKGFTNPVLLDRVHPLFAGLVEVLYDTYRVDWSLLPALPLYAAALLLLAWRKMPAGYQVAALVLPAIACLLSVQPKKAAPARYTPGAAARFLESVNLETACVFALNAPDAAQNAQGEEQPFFESFNLYAKGVPGGLMSVTSKDLGRITRDGRISLPRVEPNDWEARGYRWATLVPPFPLGEGRRALRLQARVTGPAVVELCLREGAFTHVLKTYPPGSDIDEVFHFEARGRGALYLLLRLVDGPGDVDAEFVAYAPYSEALLHKGKLRLAGSTRMTGR